ncbi:MAG: hypothetical protein AAGU32_22355, partial [Bacillota bacterium]
MESIREKAVSVLRKKPLLISVFCVVVLAASIILLFTQEKQRLDAEFESMITSSLNIHTHSNAVAINYAIADASDALSMAKRLFWQTGNDEPQSFIKQVNAAYPAFHLGYITAEELEAGALASLLQAEDGDARARLARGESVVGEVRWFQAQAGHFLPIFLPMREDGKTVGVLYTRVQADGLLPET